MFVGLFLDQAMQYMHVYNFNFSKLLSKPVCGLTVKFNWNTYMILLVAYLMLYIIVKFLYFNYGFRLLFFKYHQGFLFTELLVL